MNRRQLLRGLGISTLGLLAIPPQALAIGGILPELDQAAPGFSLGGVAPDASGEAVEATLGLADFAGQWLVLYFYPRDFTEGCTLEARGFQRDLAAFRQAGAAVAGISADDADSHSRFCGSEALAFPLLSDPGGQGVAYSWRHWLPRWEVEGPGSGWCMSFRRAEAQDDQP